MTAAIPTLGRIGWLALLLLAMAMSRPAVAQSNEPNVLEKSLALDYWDESRFAKFADRLPLTVDEEQEMHRLVVRLSMFDRRVFYSSPPQPVTINDLVESPEKYRGKFVHLQGDIEQDTPPAEGAGNVHVCRVGSDEGDCVVYTTEVPQRWNPDAPENRQVTVEGIFVKLDDQQGKLVPAIAAANLQWHPTKVDLPNVNYGMSVLGVMGVDVSLLDNVHHREPLVGKETIAFYRLMSGLRDTPPHQLVNWAERQLPRHREEWQQKQKEGDKQYQAVAYQVAKLAGEGVYSVAPYFNLPDGQEGQLVTLDGVVRQALRVDASQDIDAAACGLDHYYELALFTGDSENNPLMFCVLELPDGFPVGDDLREPVRVAGFFFKNWRYASRSSTGQLRLAPLFIGHAPLRLVAPPKQPLWGYVAGLGFIGVILLLWLAVWRRSRADGQFEAKTLARMREPAEPLDPSEAILDPSPHHRQPLSSDDRANE